MKLKEIKAGLSLMGVEPAQIVSVVATVPLGDGALIFFLSAFQQTRSPTFSSRDWSPVIGLALSYWL